jgi:uncharacterized pyridoxal phosphate-containing UPF0001 family protein
LRRLAALPQMLRALVVARHRRLEGSTSALLRWPVRFGAPRRREVVTVRLAVAVERLRFVARRRRLQLDGLMTIGPGLAIDDPEASRPCFRALKALADDCRQHFSIPLPHLSMGMSSDFDVGIEEGGTMVRIGTAIFGPRPA